MRRFLARVTWGTAIALFTAGVVAIGWGLGCPCNLGQAIALIYLGVIIWLAGAVIVAISLAVQLLLPGGPD